MWKNERPHCSATQLSSGVGNYYDDDDDDGGGDGDDVSSVGRCK